MARTGLRMMPTFPSSPLKFRTAGFPQYGFKVGLSDAAFPRAVQLPRRSVCSRPSLPRFDATFSRSEPGVFASETATMRRPTSPTPGVLAPVRVIVSRSINAYRPHPPHSQARNDFPARLVIRCVFAVPAGLSGPRVVPSFRSLFFLGMSPSETPESSSTLQHPAASSTTAAFTHPRRVRRFRYPHNSVRVGNVFRGFVLMHDVSVRFRYDLPSCSPPCRIDRSFLQPQRLLLPGFRRVGHPPRRRI